MRTKKKMEVRILFPLFLFSTILSTNPCRHRLNFMVFIGASLDVTNFRGNDNAFEQHVLFLPLQRTGIFTSNNKERNVSSSQIFVRFFVRPSLRIRPSLCTSLLNVCPASTLPIWNRTLPPPESSQEPGLRTETVSYSYSTHLMLLVRGWFV